MNYKNNIPKEEMSEIKKLYENNINQLKFSEEYFNNKEKKIEKTKQFEVITDRFNFWVSSEFLKEISSIFPSDQLSVFSFKVDNEVVAGRKYVKVSESFLEFVMENTFNPKYIPIFSLLKLKESESNFKDKDYSDKKSLLNSIRVDGAPEVVVEIESIRTR